MNSRDLARCRLTSNINMRMALALHERSAEEHREVAADVVQAIVTGVNIRILAKAWQRDEDDDEAGLHDEPGEG